MPLSLERFLKRQEQKLQLPFKLEIILGPEAEEVLADEFALNMVFRNLFENTVRHHKNVEKVIISAKRHGTQVVVLYDDLGQKFAGNLSHLGELFYKFNSTKGSGIGLYLIKNLMKKMQGYLKIINDQRLQFELTFQGTQGEGHE